LVSAALRLIATLTVMLSLGVVLEFTVSLILVLLAVTVHLASVVIVMEESMDRRH